MGQLSTEQVLLLNNLMYMNSREPFKDMANYQGKTLGELVNDIDTGKFKSNIDYTTFTNGDEWRNIIESVRNDDKLCSTRIEASYDDGKGGMSILFNNTTDNEAVVVYRGTGSPSEWKDNFQGGSVTNQPDGVSTAQQESALKWYQSQDLDGYDSVTVSGHSKGGNKAKYITIMDNSVDRCLSFDGQGFSDEFVNKYEGKIAENQYKIHNHNVDGDYVNILLNDVGDKTYYKGYNYGDGKFLENHCPNTYMKYDKDGNFVMVETSQNQDVQNLDKFLNSYLRSIPENERKDTMNLIGTMEEQALNGGSANDLLSIFTEGNNTDSAAKLLAYFIKYGQEKPEMAESIRNVLNEMGYGDSIKYVDLVENILNDKNFDKYVDVADWISGKVPDGLLQLISSYIYKHYGIKLSKEQLRKLLDMIHTVNTEMDKVQIKDNGEDIKIKDSPRDSSSGGGSHTFSVRPGILKNTSESILSQQRELQQMAEGIAAIRKRLNFHYAGLIGAMVVQEQQIERYGKYCEQLGKALQDISQKYESTETKIAGTK